MELEKIASFQVDHRRIDRGFYISRRDGDIVTYDIRMKKPNAVNVLDNAAIHSIEHLGATWLRSSAQAGKIVYFGPMGCRTGFYLLVQALDHAAAIDLVRGTFEFIAGYEGPMPGASEAECGNWLDHDLEGARREARLYLPVLEGYSLASLDYPA
jgi:S-ribosylhomocysteine lyase